MPAWNGTGLSFDDWPVWLQAAWHRACKPNDSFLEQGGAFADWRPGTLDNARAALSEFLAGFDGPLSPTDRLITRDNVSAYIASMYQRNLKIGTIHTRAAFLFRVAKRLWPDDDWAWFGMMVSRLAQHKYAAPRVQRPFIHLRELYTAGFALMDEAASRRIGVYRVLQYRDGLILALLAVAPVRIKNAQQAREEHLNVRARTISWESHETKNHEPLCYDLPDDLTERLRQWLDVYRPWLLAHFGTESTALWLNRHGNGLSIIGLRHRIKFRSENAFGKTVRPHDIRSCVATSIIMDFPERVEDARNLLGHRHPESIEPYKSAAAAFGAQRKTKSARAQIRQRARQRRKPRLRLSDKP